MVLNKKYLVIILLLSAKICLSQSYNKGIVIEGTIASTKYYKTFSNISGDSDTTLTNRNVFEMGFGYAWRFNLLLGTKVELKPTLLLGDPNFMGLDLSVSLRSPEIWRLYFAVGIVTHWSFGYSDNHNTGSSQSPGYIYLFPGAMIGARLIGPVSLQIGYYATSEHKFRKGWYSNVNQSTTYYYYEEIFWMIRGGVEISIK